MKIGFIGVWQVCAHSSAALAEIKRIALAACDPIVFRRARTQPVKVLLPYRQFPYGLWCATGEAAQRLRRPVRTLHEQARRQTELTATLEGSKARLVFVVALRKRGSR